MEPHLLALADKAAEAVARFAPGHLTHGYVRAMALTTAKAWNEETRRQADAPRKSSSEDAFERAVTRAPVMAQGITTEVNGFAKVDTAKRMGKTTKTWRVRSRNPREAHLLMDGDTVPVGQAFSNGMMWPGGPNCQCDVTFERSGDVGQVVDPLRLDDFDIPSDSLSRTRAVTDDEYQGLAAEGQVLLARWRANRTPPAALDDDWDGVRRGAWDSVQDEWGGLTVDAHTGRAVEAGQKKFAISIKEPGQTTVSVPIGSTREEFDAALDEARRRFDLSPEKSHLGVFRDDGAGRIDVDPVIVVDSLAEVERIGAYSRSAGGAYSFEDGLGYWPPHVK